MIWKIWKVLFYTDAKSIKISETWENHRLHLSGIYISAEKNKYKFISSGCGHSS